ncbi:sushi, von Willebrand factor type A, EGF and pentraxin domain-containing protein 1-like [Sycon ciliatum]|uniref:sushi, von Willebrand factor type A, EGF and pentraxin domain-containing protein 1-like n=1 Tax=Sycon ciliatum TaxID=27933 RepID=UPI0031F6442D
MAWSTYFRLCTVLTAIVQVYAQRYDYAFHFNCNTASGLYYISSSTWRSTLMAEADNICTQSNRYTLVNSSDTSTACFGNYLAHIYSQIGNTTVYTSTGNGGVSCYPPASPCPPTALVICKQNLVAASPQSTSPKCPANLTLANAIVTYPSGLRFPSVAYYTCAPGYRFSGYRNYADCDTLGMWLLTDGKFCSSIQCQGALPAPVNGTVSPGGMHYLSTRTYSCNLGFHLVGQNTTFCQADTQWSGSTPTCADITCKIPTIPNGNVQASSQSLVLPGTFIFISCMEGYVSIGANIATCQANQTWSALPTCSRLTTQSRIDYTAGGVGVIIGVLITGLACAIAILIHKRRRCETKQSMEKSKNELPMVEPPPVIMKTMTQSPAYEAAVTSQAVPTYEVLPSSMADRPLPALY